MDDTVNAGIVVHGSMVQLGWASRIERSSPIDGSRQSQCPAKQSVVALPSVDTPPLSVPRNAVNAVPSGAVPSAVALHVYRLSLSWTLPSSVLSSHWSPLLRSVAVPSPLANHPGPPSLSARKSASVVAWLWMPAASPVVGHSAPYAVSAEPNFWTMLLSHLV